MTSLSLRFGAAALAVSLFAAPALAGPVAAFEDALREAYADYRVALFATNTGKAEEAASALARFEAAWDALSARPVPPQYEADGAFGTTLASVDAVAAEASDEIASGALSQAHLTLEQIRDEIGALHARNGVVAFSDRMNAYHAEMEEALETDPADRDGLRERLGVLVYLEDDLVAHPPKETGAEFEKLLAGVSESLDRLRTALDSSDEKAVESALSGLKAPYARLFLKFG